MADNGPVEDPVGEDSRITSLQERLARVEHDEKVRIGSTEQRADDGTRLGNRVLAELIGGLVGGAVIGWVLDRLIGTTPWLLLVFLFMGIVVAFRNIIRISTGRPK